MTVRIGEGHIVRVAFCLALLLAAPGIAGASQCEPPGAAGGAATALDVSQIKQVEGIPPAVHAAAAADLLAPSPSLNIEGLKKSIKGKVEGFWGQWQQAMRAMTKQLSAGMVDESRQLGGFQDAVNTVDATLAMQKQKALAMKRYQPTEAGCRFDTAAPFVGSSRAVSSALAAGYAQDFINLGGNTAGHAAAFGGAALQRARWEAHQKFCDKEADAGQSGCKEEGAMANAQVLPGKTVFSKDTIDLADPATRLAVKELMLNITGYTPPEPIPPGAFKQDGGLRQRQSNREYIAQMDAVGALAYSVVAESAPGRKAPKIQELRRKMGVTDASETPSQREIRAAIIEQLWDPNYYRNLYDEPATLGQKELYLKAYGLVMLYDIIARQEKISSVYAIETANMLHGLDQSRGSASAGAALDGGEK